MTVAEDANGATGVVTQRLLRRLAGERYYGRGEAYFADGAVRSLRHREGGVEAVVQGTRRYRVRLRAKDSELEYDCNCPVGRGGEFCKHCVAVGLAWQAVGGNGEAGADIHEHSAFPENDTRDYLLGLDKEELVSIVLERADEDERFQRKLMLRAANQAPGIANPAVWKGVLDDALRTDDFVRYHKAYDHFSGVEDVIESLEDLLRTEQAEQVIGLAEYGLDAIEESLEYVDDSDGWIGGLLHQLQKLHLQACRIARPDPADLAERLFEAEMDSNYDTFHRAVFVYADILGEAGLAAYRRLAEAEWAAIPALGPGDEDSNRYGRRYRITSIMEALARSSEDFEAVVAVKSRDLSSPYEYLRIAQLYEEREDTDRALDWAEQGWRAFSGKLRDERLRAFIAEMYQARGRHDEAMALIWEAFSERPLLQTYLQLKAHGQHAGTWPDWREKAVALIRERIADRKAEQPDRRPWLRTPLQDHSLIVEIFLDEGDSAAAWREAEAGGCSGTLWLALAKTRERSHPQDAVRIYENHVAALLRNTGDRIYEEAVGLVERIRAILARSGADSAFRSYLTELRATHKRKRNLMKLLDRKGW